MTAIAKNLYDGTSSSVLYTDRRNFYVKENMVKEQSARYADTTLAGYKAQGVDDPTAKRYFERLHFKDVSRSAECAVDANKAWEEHIAKPGRPASKPKLESPLPPGVDGAITEQTTIITVDDAFNERLKDPADKRQL